MPRHARPGRRTFGADPGRRLGTSDPAGGPRADVDLARRRDPRGYLQDDEHRAQRHTDAVVRRCPQARAAVGDHRLHRLSRGEQRTRLFQSRRRQARAGSHRSHQGGGELCNRSGGPLPGRRADHGARTLVPSACDQRHHPGDLRRRLHRRPRSMARHERGESGKERALASGAAGGGRGGAPQPGSRRHREAPSRPRRRIPLPSRQPRPPRRHRSSPTPSRSRFLRRCRPAPASPTSSSATARTRWISGSSIWPDPIRFSSPAREAGTSLPTPRAISLVSRVTTRENGRSFSSGRSRQPRAPPSRPAASCRLPSRSGTGSRASAATSEVSRSGTSLYVEPEEVPSPAGPMAKTALLILAIEIAVIGWVRRRKPAVGA